METRTARLASIQTRKRHWSSYSFLPTYIVGIYAYFDVRTSTIFLRLAYTGALFTPGPRPARPTDKHIHAS